MHFININMNKCLYPLAGVLRCEVRGPNGSVPVNVQGSSGRYIVSYMPTMEGLRAICVINCYLLIIIYFHI